MIPLHRIPNARIQYPKDDYFYIYKAGREEVKQIVRAFGGCGDAYKYQFAMQVSKCPFACKKCADREVRQFSAYEIVNKFVAFRSAVLDNTSDITLNVITLFGDSALSCPQWPVLRAELDRRRLKGIIIVAYTFLVEQNVSGLKPWTFSDINHVLIMGYLKGIDQKDFHDKSKSDLFSAAVSELKWYYKCPNFSLIIESKEVNWKGLFALVPRNQVIFSETPLCSGNT